MYNNRRQITESELRNVIRDIIAEEIQYGNLDEGFWDMVKAGGRAIGGAFKGDASRAGSSMVNAAGNAAGAVGRGARAVGDAVGRGARAVGDAVGRGAQAVGDYAQSRGRAVKGMYNAQMNMNKINDLIKTLDELQQSGVLTGPKMSQAIAAIKQQLQGAISRNKGAMTGWRNSVN